MNDLTDVKDIVKKEYGQIAKTAGQCGCGSCSCGSKNKIQKQSGQLGYSEAEMTSVPNGSNLGLGCGNPTALASLKEGEVVLDLGSGAGIDVFLASKIVGPTGKAIGVDMTDEMLSAARENAKKGGFTNVEFIKGDIEALPLDNNSVDVVISNCVINLAPSKAQVFAEIYRVLKTGGRLMVSDVVLTKPLPLDLKNDQDLLVGCISGAILKEDYLNLLKQAGFTNIEIHKETPSFLPEYSLSITFSATK
ncbi:MAG: arsenite methyltransferase [Candidatus Shapirobacteria bacterium]